MTDKKRNVDATINCDILIVGGGIAGAGLGCLLAAKTNLNAVLIEASAQLGGRARSIDFAGQMIDFGLHALLLGKRSSLFKMGKVVTSGIAVNPLGASIFRHGRLERLVGRSPVSFLASKGLELRSLLAMMRRVYLSGHRKDLYRISLDELCRQYRASENVQDFLRCLSVGLVVNKNFSKVSAGEILAYLQLSARRASLAGYPKGGWKSIWDRFEKILCEYKLRVNLGEQLKEIRVQNGRVTHCLTDKGTYKPKRVVLAVPAQTIVEERLIPAESIDSETWKRLCGCKITYGINIDLLIEAGHMPQDIIFTLDPPTLAMIPTTASPGLVGPGRHLMTIFEPLGTDPSTELVEIQARGKALIDFYDRILPKLKNHILDQKISVLPVLGAEVTTDSNFLDRPEIQCPSPENLFMIGDWVKCPGVGGERAFAGALKCFELLTK